MGDEERQQALSYVYELASTLHALRALTDEVEALLADATKIATRTGVSQAIVAEASGRSRGRVSQIVADGQPTSSAAVVRDRTAAIREWPADALRHHRATFAGTMTMPPYQRRRNSGS